MKAEKDEFLAKLKKERQSLYKKLRDFEKTLSEGQCKKLTKRKQTRKEERYSQWLKDKKEEEERKQEGQKRRNEEGKACKNKEREERLEQERVQKEQREREYREKREMLECSVAKQTTKEEESASCWKKKTTRMISRVVGGGRMQEVPKKIREKVQNRHGGRLVYQETKIGTRVKNLKKLKLGLLVTALIWNRSRVGDRVVKRNVIRLGIERDRQDDKDRHKISRGVSGFDRDKRGHRDRREDRGFDRTEKKDGQKGDYRDGDRLYDHDRDSDKPRGYDSERCFVRRDGRDDRRGDDRDRKPTDGGSFWRFWKVFRLPEAELHGRMDQSGVKTAQLHSVTRR